MGGSEPAGSGAGGAKRKRELGEELTLRAGVRVSSTSKRTIVFFTGRSLRGGMIAGTTCAIMIELSGLLLDQRQARWLLYTACEFWFQAPDRSVVRGPKWLKTNMQVGLNFLAFGHNGPVDHCGLCLRSLDTMAHIDSVKATSASPSLRGR